jgi:hypothetical protein
MEQKEMLNEDSIGLYEMGVIAHQLALLFIDDISVFSPVTDELTHLNDMVTTVSYLNTNVQANIAKARHYVEALKDGRSLLAGNLPYMAYPDFVIRLQPGGFNMFSNVSHLMSCCDGLDYDRKQLDKFIMNLRADWQKRRLQLAA